jgi:glutaredoxin
MSMTRRILFDHGHIGDEHIPSFINSIRLVLHDHEHVTLHTPRSCQHCRSTHPFLRWFVRLVLQDHEHVTLHSTRSCPHWRSTQPFLRRFVRLVLHDHEHVTLHTPRSCPHWRLIHSCSPTGCFVVLYTMYRIISIPMRDRIFCKDATGSSDAT